MCSRFYLNSDFKGQLNRLIDDYGITADDLDLRMSGRERDVRPSEKALVIAGFGEGLFAGRMDWGFLNPAQSGLLINARSESVKEKYSFSDSYMKRRCVIPASGFYEWDLYKARYRFYRKDDEPVLLAGLFREESGVKKFTILTRSAAGPMVSIHDRMPLIIEKEEMRGWITDDSSAERLLMREPVFLLRDQDAGQISMVF